MTANIKARYEAELKFVEDNKEKAQVRVAMEGGLKHIQKMFPEYSDQLGFESDRFTFNYSTSRSEMMISFLALLRKSSAPQRLRKRK